MAESDPLVTLRHMRMAKVCVSGTREWFSRTGLSFDTFARTGLPASVIEATGDALAIRVAGEARREAAAAATEGAVDGR